MKSPNAQNAPGSVLIVSSMLVVVLFRVTVVEEAGRHVAGWMFKSEF
jgi:hypothetical protein